MEGAMAALRGTWLVLAVALSGCGEPRTPNEVAQGLRSGDVDERVDAAQELCDRGTPRALVQPLIGALSVERDPEAKRAMLGALGRSGAPEARPWIDAYRADPDPSVRAAAAAAAEDNLVVAGQLWPTVYGSPPPERDPYPPTVEVDVLLQPQPVYYAPPVHRPPARPR